MLTGILAWLAAQVAGLGPLALFGGPIGVAVAALGSVFANRTMKLILIGGGLVLLVAVSVGLTVHVERLEADATAYRTLSAEVVSLQTKYGCAARPEHERELAACLTARERDADTAEAAEVTRQRTEAAVEQADLDRRQRAADDESAAMQNFIDDEARTGDGPVPQVLRNTWARERKERGLK